MERKVPDMQRRLKQGSSSQSLIRMTQTFLPPIPSFEIKSASEKLVDENLSHLQASAEDMTPMCLYLRKAGLIV